MVCCVGRLQSMSTLVISSRRLPEDMKIENGLFRQPYTGGKIRRTWTPSALNTPVKGLAGTLTRNVMSWLTYYYSTCCLYYLSLITWSNKLIIYTQPSRATGPLFVSPIPRLVAFSEPLPLLYHGVAAEQWSEVGNECEWPDSGTVQQGLELGVEARELGLGTRTRD